jgi:prolyl-tRNA editing enzyme YbaK/EbsC (Cys-tRNA(Pro) deacylase)
MNNEIKNRIEQCNNRVGKLLQIMNLNIDDNNVLHSEEVIRCKSKLIKEKCYVYKFYVVPNNYYDLTLLQRRDILQAKELNQLCKSIIFENTACSHKNYDDPTDSRYYCVIVQYATRFDAELLKDVIHVLRKPTERIQRNKFHFKLASEDDSFRISGFKHNAITPFGLKLQIPFVLCSRIVETAPDWFYMGGGQIDVKLGMPTKDFIRSMKPIIGRISKLEEVED